MPDKWDEESSGEESSEPTPAQTASNRRKFDDEEDDEEVLDSWSAAEDSEVEREKAKVEAERKAKADALAAANKKSKAQRVADKQAERARQLAEDSDESSEDEASRRERLRRTEQESDLKHAEDLFGNIGINSRKSTSAANAVQVEGKNPAATVDLTTLPLFDPRTKPQFEKLRETLVPLIANNVKKAHYIIFLQEFTKQISKDLPSDQIKKIASTLTALSNEKMKEEKAAEKGGKKSKAAKTKATLNASRNTVSNPDTQAYEDDFGDDDFM